MRLAIAISLGVICQIFSAARADGPFIGVAMSMGSHAGYIVPEEYATDHELDMVASMPGMVRVEGFWTPTEPEVIVAERVFRELIHDAVKDPSLLFPELAESDDPSAAEIIQHEQNELALVSQNYDSYVRQYVGIILDGRKVIFCNYSDIQRINPATGYIFIQKTFALNGSDHFLQCRYDVEAKSCSNVSIIGTWQPKASP